MTIEEFNFGKYLCAYVIAQRGQYNKTVLVNWM